MHCARCGQDTPTDPCVRCGAPALVSGRFQLEEQLFSDEEATTWAALDMEAGELVAITRLSADWQDGDPGDAREIVAGLCRVAHPALAGVRWGEVEPDALWFAQEYVLGESLRGPLPEDEVLDALAPVAEALAALHLRQLVHGAVRPGALVSTDAGTRLVGQGLLRQAAGLPAAGTAYIPPECLLEPPADVYALGITAVALLTGQVPQPGQVRWEVEALHVRGVTQEVLQAMLLPAPELRPAAADLVPLLRACRQAEPAPPRREPAPRHQHAHQSQEPAPPKQGTSLLTLMVWVVLIGVGGAVFAAFFAEEEPQEPEPIPVRTAGSLFGVPLGSTPEQVRAHRLELAASPALPAGEVLPSEEVAQRTGVSWGVGMEGMSLAGTVREEGIALDCTWVFAVDYQLSQVRCEPVAGVDEYLLGQTLEAELAAGWGGGEYATEEGGSWLRWTWEDASAELHRPPGLELTLRSRAHQELVERLRARADAEAELLVPALPGSLPEDAPEDRFNHLGSR